MLIAAAPALIALTAGALLVSIGTTIAALRWRSFALRDRLALRIAVERETAFVESARRLADAARTSVEDVRTEIERAVTQIVSSVDVVLFFEEIDAQLECVAAAGSRVAYFDGSRFALDDETSLLVRALRSGHRVIARDMPVARPLHPGDTFAVAIPLVLDAGRRCVMYIASPDARLEELADSIVRLIDQATPAYRVARERADDRARAEYDGLTGLLTGRALRVQLANAVEHARCTPGGRLALLFIDTDRFKAWNDTYGHASGDALLRELATVLQAAARQPGDIAARNGGDEFCVVFAQTEKSNAIERAERLRASIAGADFSGLHAPDTGGEAVRISASIGVACFPVDAQSPEVLLEKADEAMYHSKKSGRDGVSFFGVDLQLARADGTAPGQVAERRRD